MNGKRDNDRGAAKGTARKRLDVDAVVEQPEVNANKAKVIKQSAISAQSSGQPEDNDKENGMSKSNERSNNGPERRHVQQPPSTGSTSRPSVLNASSTAADRPGPGGAPASPLLAFNRHAFQKSNGIDLQNSFGFGMTSQKKEPGPSRHPPGTRMAQMIAPPLKPPGQRQRGRPPKAATASLKATANNDEPLIKKTRCVRNAKGKNATALSTLTSVCEEKEEDFVARPVGAQPMTPNKDTFPKSSSSQSAIAASHPTTPPLDCSRHITSQYRYISPGSNHSQSQRQPVYKANSSADSGDEGDFYSSSPSARPTEAPKDYYKSQPNCLRPSSSFQRITRSKAAASSTEPDGDSSDSKGLANIGNTCYMNVTLQALFCLQPFVQSLTRAHQLLSQHLPDKTLLNALVDLIEKRATLNGAEKREQLRLFKQAVAHSKDIFDGYRQQDAQEFLSSVLNQLHDEIAAAAKQLDQPPPKQDQQENRDSNNNQSATPEPDATEPDEKKESEQDQNGEDDEQKERLGDFQPPKVINPVSEYFSFVVQRRFTCKNCSAQLNRDEAHFDLPLPVPTKIRDSSVGAPIALEQMLKVHFGCDTCTRSCVDCGHADKASTVTDTLNTLPKILVLHIKRSYFDPLLLRERKSGAAIGFPARLDLAAYFQLVPSAMQLKSFRQHHPDFNMTLSSEVGAASQTPTKEAVAQPSSTDEAIATASSPAPATLNTSSTTTVPDTPDVVSKKKRSLEDPTTTTSTTEVVATECSDDQPAVVEEQLCHTPEKEGEDGDDECYSVDELMTQMADQDRKEQLAVPGPGMAGDKNLDETAVSAVEQARADSDDESAGPPSKRTSSLSLLTQDSTSTAAEPSELDDAESTTSITPTAVSAAANSSSNGKRGQPTFRMSELYTVGDSPAFSEPSSASAHKTKSAVNLRTPSSHNSSRTPTGSASVPNACRTRLTFGAENDDDDDQGEEGSPANKSQSETAAVDRPKTILDEMDTPYQRALSNVNLRRRHRDPTKPLLVPPKPNRSASSTSVGSSSQRKRARLGDDDDDAAAGSGGAMTPVSASQSRLHVNNTPGSTKNERSPARLPDGFEAGDAVNDEDMATLMEKLAAQDEQERLEKERRLKEDEVALKVAMEASIAESAHDIDMHTTMVADEGDRQTAEQQQSYELTAVLSHIGLTSSSGHYVCDVRDSAANGGGWLQCDDSDVTPTQLPRVLASRTRTAYILVYVLSSVQQPAESSAPEAQSPSTAPSPVFTQSQKKRPID